LCGDTVICFDTATFISALLSQPGEQLQAGVSTSLQPEQMCKWCGGALILFDKATFISVLLTEAGEQLLVRPCSAA
jgi:hypothetical protein